MPRHSFDRVMPLHANIQMRMEIGSVSSFMDIIKVDQRQLVPSGSLLPLRLEFPQYIYDYPLAIELRHVQIVDPIRSDNLYAGRVLENIKDCNVLLLFLFGCALTAATSCSQHERHSAHLVKSTIALLIRARDSLG